MGAKRHRVMISNMEKNSLALTTSVKTNNQEFKGLMITM